LFVYLTAELFPVGVLAELSAGLRVRPATAGLLLAAYAVVAGATTLPAVHWTRRADRRSVLTASMALLAVSQLVLAVAPDFAVAALSRGTAAVAHGLVWSQVPVVASRFASPGQGGRVTARVFAGSSLGLVAGAPLCSAVAHAAGWRCASSALAVAAALVAVLLRRVLPPAPARGERQAAGTVGRGPVAAVCLATIALVTGHYVSYGYLTLLIAPAGLTGAAVAPTLGAYGAAGLLGVSLAGRRLDARPRAVGLAVTAALTAAVAALAAAYAVWLVLPSVLVWGASAAALPVILQTAVLRAAPGAAETASGAYVVAYQVGIAGGSALGAVLLDHTGAQRLPVWSTVLLLAGTLLVAAGRAVFGAGRPVPEPASRGARPPAPPAGPPGHSG